MSQQQHLANIAKIIGVSLEDLKKITQSFSPKEFREKIVPSEKQKEVENEVAKLLKEIKFERTLILLKYKKPKVLWFLIILVKKIAHKFKNQINKCFPKSSQKV